MNGEKGDDGVSTVASLDHDIARRWCRVQLDQALEGVELEHRVPGGLGGAAGLEALGLYLERARPVLLVESDQPYAEHLVAELVAETGRLGPPHAIPALLSGGAGLAARFGRRQVLVISFHEPPPPEDDLALLHRLDTTDNPVLLGCRSRFDVPEGYRQRADLVLTLPAGSGETFARVFGELWGQSPGETGTGEAWRDFVLPTDLQQPRRLGYDAKAALTYIRRRAEARLRNVAADDAPRLEDLHGLGEARLIAQDLIRDIHLARDGRIRWDEVDRGLLLVGAPGTGKTTLARAIARECGIKFIVASATRWQAVENLGQHLAAIKASFAEARRHQPAILFIDEIDSIGNRERFSGSEATYQTPVVNTLLEQLDGFGPRDRVFVVAATNHVEMVDPALRRAGRLDQVVEVPYPTVQALAAIYTYHLRPYREADRLDDGIDVDELAGLSFGLTGADVEFFVRGAARRARRRRARMGQADLVAEILRKPRAGATGHRIDAGTRRRLAVHEAGHALARLLGPAQGRDLAYVAITPRSDGRVGYVAATVQDTVSATSADYLHEIRVLLAGRAAEEATFGRDGVSTLAADGGEDSDLARATAAARFYLGATGLGSGPLVWWKGLPALAARALPERVARLLDEEYARLLATMRAHRELLDAIGRRLLERQELTGAELRRLAAGERA